MSFPELESQDCPSLVATCTNPRYTKKFKSLKSDGWTRNKVEADLRTILQFNAHVSNKLSNVTASFSEE